MRNFLFLSLFLFAACDSGSEGDHFLVGTFESGSIRLEITEIDGAEVHATIHADTSSVDVSGFASPSALLSGSIHGDSLIKLDGTIMRPGTDVEALVESENVLLLDIFNLFEFGDFTLENERLTRSQP